MNPAVRRSERGQIQFFNSLLAPALQAMFIAGIGTFIAYKMHYWVERTFKIDDAVGAVAVHGYAGFYGIVMAGFILW